MAVDGLSSFVQAREPKGSQFSSKRNLQSPMHFFPPKIHQHKNMSKETEFIRNAAASHQVVIFSKSYCPYCRSTKQLFSSHPDVQVYELDQMPNGAALQRSLVQLTGQRTVPNTFVNGQHIGGNDDVQMAQRNGRLQQMLSVNA